MQIEIFGLHHTYPGGVHTVQGITMRIEPGEQVALVGENGAGKTALVKHLNGLLRPSSGRVRIGFWDTQDRAIAELAGGVGHVFLNPDDQLFSRTVEDDIAFGPQNRGFRPIALPSRSTGQPILQSLMTAAQRIHTIFRPPGEKW